MIIKFEIKIKKIYFESFGIKKFKRIKNSKLYEVLITKSQTIMRLKMVKFLNGINSIEVLFKTVLLEKWF